MTKFTREEITRSADETLLDGLTSSDPSVRAMARFYATGVFDKFMDWVEDEAARSKEPPLLLTPTVVEALASLLGAYAYRTQLRPKHRAIATQTSAELALMIGELFGRYALRELVTADELLRSGHDLSRIKEARKRAVERVNAYRDQLTEAAAKATP